MEIQEYHNRINLLLDKAQTGYFSPDQIDTAIDMAGISMFNSYNRIYGTDTDSVEALSVFKIIQIQTTNADGKLTTLKPCQRMLSITTAATDGTGAYRRPVKFINDDELASRLSSQTKPVNVDYPVALVTGDGTYQMYPKIPMSAQVIYLTTPTKAKFAYTTNSEGDVAHDPANSTAPEWLDKHVDAVIYRALQVLGVNLDNPLLTQTGNSWQAATQ